MKRQYYVCYSNDRDRDESVLFGGGVVKYLINKGKKSLTKAINSKAHAPSPSQYRWFPK